jgi:hypothetical protein
VLGKVNAFSVDIGDLIRCRMAIINTSGNVEPSSKKSKMRLSGDGKRMIELYMNKVRLFELNDLLVCWRDFSYQQKLAVIAIAHSTINELDGPLRKMLLTFPAGVQARLLASITEETSNTKHYVFNFSKQQCALLGISLIVGGISVLFGVNQ